MKKSGFFIFFIFFVTLSLAQGNVTYNLEKGIENIEQQYISAWKKVKKIEGFTIQITSFSGVNSRVSIERTEAQFRQQFPDIPSHVSYSEPNFRLRVGNFNTKLEAYNALQKIALSFAGAFVLRDQIDVK